MRVRSRPAAALLLLTAPALGAQTRPSPPLAPRATADGPRPVPGPVYEIPEYTRAVARGTRSRDGRPGAGYWVQHARYAIEARLAPATDRVAGTERVVYQNNAPDTLRRIAVYLRQNAFAPGNPHQQSAPVTGGVTLGRVAVDGCVVPAASSGVAAVPITDVDRRRAAGPGGYTVDGTVMWIPLARPLPPRDSARLELAWSYTPPPSPADGREGREGHRLYFMGYWYPQVAVYDDVHGWVADPYLLQAEFYMDPADYDVRLTVPRGWAVGATGTLENAGEILSPAARTRLAEARRSGAVVHVAEPGGAGAFAGRGAEATWHFVAPNVRDFAWGASDQYVWDATRALVGDSSRGAARDTVDVYSFYRRHAPAAAWALGAARFTRDAVESLSAYLWPYPWPTMTSMEGVLDSGGMEYPTLTLMQPWADTLSLAGDLTHETGHMWFPMQVGSSETRYPWMDEGFTQFDVAQAMRARYGEPRAGGRPGDSEPGQRALYLAAARAGRELTLMWPGDLYPQDLYFVMFYDKTAQALAALRGVLGEATFHHALREYGRRWTGRHPYPYDFFNTVSDVAGRDLSWFWTTWFYEPWSLDQAVASVTTQGDSTAVTVEDRGLAPMPVVLAVTRAGGGVQRVTVPVDVWLAGARRHVVRLPATPAVVRVEIDPDGLFPDVDRSNQVWPAARGGP
ncbi:peptidase [Gemmatimonadetes bacterium T265]|nr:peptidase [Gemmatimonadetes bacterium T265]